MLVLYYYVFNKYTSCKYKKSKYCFNGERSTWKHSYGLLIRIIYIYIYMFVLSKTVCRRYENLQNRISLR